MFYLFSLYICFYYYYFDMNIISDWFYYSTAQRRGIVVLLVLMFLILIGSEAIKRTRTHRAIDTEAFLKEVALFEEMLRKAEEAETLANAEVVVPDRQRQRPVFHPFVFDPNVMTDDDWERLGMPSHISRSIQNFLRAGGQFRHKEDFQRIFLLEDWMYEELESYIDLPSRPPPRPQTAEKSATEEPQGVRPASIAKPETTSPPLLVNISRADSMELRQIRGIGPAFSRRIISYRELLGGFIDTKQLLEVFGLDSTRYESIREFVITDSIPIRKININQADFPDLVRHPYIDRQMAGAILNLRRQHGPFASPADLKRSYLIDEALFQRVSPYLCVDENRD